MTYVHMHHGVFEWMLAVLLFRSERVTSEMTAEGIKWPRI